MGFEEESLPFIFGSISESCSNASVLKQIAYKLMNMMEEIEVLKREQKDVQRKMDESSASANSVASSMMEFFQNIVKQMKEDRDELVKEMEEDRIELLESISHKNAVNTCESTDGRNSSAEKVSSNEKRTNDALPALMLSNISNFIASDTPAPQQSTDPVASTSIEYSTPLQTVLSKNNKDGNKLLHLDSETLESSLQPVLACTKSDLTSLSSLPANAINGKEVLAQPFIIKSIPVEYNSSLIPDCNTALENIASIAKDMPPENFQELAKFEDDPVMSGRPNQLVPISPPPLAPSYVPVHDKHSEIDDDSDEGGLDIRSSEDFVSHNHVELPKSPRQGSSAGSTTKESAKFGNGEIAEKLLRNCYYCNKKFRYISKHLMYKHKNEELVSKAMNLGIGRLRSKALRKIMILGINAENIEKLRKGEDIICLRRQKQETAKVMCCSCKGIFKRNNLAVHKKKCVGPTTIGHDFISLESMKRKSSIPNNPSLHQNFEEKILDKLKCDEVGIEIKKNNLLQVIANDEFERLLGRKSERQIRKRVSGNVRRITKTFFQLNKNMMKKRKSPVLIHEIFDVEMFQEVKLSVQQLCATSDNEIKSVIKLYDSSIKKSSKALISHFRETRQQKLKETVEEFYSHYKINSLKVISSVDQDGFSKRCILRRAVSMPTDAEIGKLKEFVLNEFEELASPTKFWDRLSYIRLRRAVVTRLTFFNGCRPIEVCELTSQEWELAKQRAYITQDQIKYLTENESNLLGKFHLAYNKSKIYGTEVSLIIPESCWMAMDILSSTEIREQCGVNPKNEFVMPACIKSSTDATTSYHDIRDVCERACVPISFSADKVRHFVSTAFGHLDADERTKSLFFSYMGHSSTSSERIYQMPQALQTILKIAPILKEIEEKNSKPYEGANENVDDKTEAEENAQDSEDFDSDVSDPSLSPIKSPVKQSLSQHNRPKAGDDSARHDLDEDSGTSSESEFDVSTFKRTKTNRGNFQKKRKYDTGESHGQNALERKKGTERRKTIWRDEDKQAMKTFFSDFIYGKTQKFPNNEEYLEFLEGNKTFLEDVSSPRDRKKRWRFQIYNLRNSSIRKAKKALNKLHE